MGSWGGGGEPTEKRQLIKKKSGGGARGETKEREGDCAQGFTGGRLICAQLKAGVWGTGTDWGEVDGPSLSTHETRLGAKARFSARPVS